MTNEANPTRPPRFRSIADRIADPGPKRILALDGGGVRGVLSIQFLKRIEAILRARHNDPELRLCDYFDLIIGTSTGSILAAGLAMGHDASWLEQRYNAIAGKVFGRVPAIVWVVLATLAAAAAAAIAFTLAPFDLGDSIAVILGLWLIAMAVIVSSAIYYPAFDGEKLYAYLKQDLGDDTLESEKLLTGFGAVSKRVDSDSIWVLTNNPNSPYWSEHKNKDYKLADLVRASTAAPYFFAPQGLKILEFPAGRPKLVEGAFLDGGLSMHNSPCVLALMLARIKGYRFNWKDGPDNLLIVSVGTGSWRNEQNERAVLTKSAVRQAIDSLRGMIADSEKVMLTFMQWVSRTPQNKGWRIDGEIGNLEHDQLGDNHVCSFIRYNVTLEEGWLHKRGWTKTSARFLRRMREMTNPGPMAELSKLAAHIASDQVEDSDFPPAFDLT